MQLTKQQRRQATNLLIGFRDVPSLLTAREAASLCEQHGVANSKYARRRDQDNHLLRLIDVCIYIARNTGGRTR